MELFEIAIRNKYRFPFKGWISTEDLWDLSVQNLDSIFKTLNKEFKTTGEESLLGTRPPSRMNFPIRSRSSSISSLSSWRIRLKHRPPVRTPSAASSCSKSSPKNRIRHSMICREAELQAQLVALDAE